MNSTSITHNDQPGTTAKVAMMTTMGQIQIQLWAREAPLACRYYDNTIFHRMVPGFMVQGGDPSGTGSGGQSIYGKPFKDQFHKRIKFSRRGMVAMVSSGKNTNNSQFFITFCQCSHLDKTNTIFGKVIGDSIYQLLGFQQLQTDQNDRPLYPPYIRKIKIILNPFDDIIPRNINSQKQSIIINNQQNIQQQKYKKISIKKLKNKNKLTFNLENYDNQLSYKIQSSHDTLNDHKLSKKLAITHQQISQKRKCKQKQQQKISSITKKIQQINTAQNTQNITSILNNQLLKKMKQAQGNIKLQDQILNYQKVINQQTGKMQIIWKDEIQNKQQNPNNKKQNQCNMEKLRQLQDRQKQAMIAQQLNFKKIKQGSRKQKRKQLILQQKTLLSNVQKKRYEYLKKNQVQKKQGQVLTKLNQFTQKLKIENPNSWMCHNLKFHIDSQNAYNLDKNNQQRKGRNQVQDDGGLKIQYQKLQNPNQQFDLDQLNQLAKGESP